MYENFSKFTSGYLQVFATYANGFSKSLEIQQDFIKESNDLLVKHFESLTNAKDLQEVYATSTQATNAFQEKAIKVSTKHFDHAKELGKDLTAAFSTYYSPEPAATSKKAK